MTKKEPTLKEQGFYHTAVWRRLRVLALQRDRSLCQKCLKNKRIKRATEVHHVVSVESSPELALELANLESLCRDCHEATKARRPVRVFPARVIKISDGSGHV